MTYLTMIEAAEVWKPVFGFAKYEVSSLGRVRSLADWRCPVRILKGGTSRGGYIRVTFYAGDGRLVQRYVHRLVCAAFHGEPDPEKNQSCHRDGNKANNAETNLYWGTHKDNTADAIRHGTHVVTRHGGLVMLR